MTSSPAAVDPTVRLNISDVQAALKADGLDGWLLYDFRGLNPIAADVTGVLRQGGHLATRRWYYLIPASGEPRGLVHAIEKNSLAHLPGTTERYAGRDQLEAGLRRLLSGVRRVAMEYSPGCAIPYVARVDAGTIELVRQSGAEVVSSGDLIQRFSSVWDAATIATHLEASDKLYRVKDRALEAIARRLRDRVATTEYDIQQLMAGWFNDEGLVVDDVANVSAAENAGNPHYLPTATSHRKISRMNWCCSISGASCLDPARCLLTLRGWDSPAAGCPIASRTPSQPSVPLATPRLHWCSRRRRAAASFTGGKWIARRPRSSARPGMATASCIERVTASAKRSTAPA
jgi:hypothetical protein